MKKTATIAVAAMSGILQMVDMHSAVANELLKVYAPRATAIYVPKSTDGEAFARQTGCGFDGKDMDSFARDLGQGAAIKVTPTRAEHLIAVNILFLYGEKDGLKLSPYRFELHSWPDGKTFSLTTAYRSEVRKNGLDRYSQEIYLEYSIGDGSADRISLVVPEGAVTGLGGALPVAPVEFEKSGMPNEAARVRCTYAADPAVEIDPKKLRFSTRPTVTIGIRFDAQQ